MKRTSSGRRNVPIKAVVYGIPGIGKTTFCAGAPDVTMLDLENGSSHLDVARIEIDTFDEAVEVVREHRSGTLVIDSLSKLEELVSDKVLGPHKDTPGINMVNFGKGYGEGWQLALQYFRVFVAAVMRSPANVLLVAHSQVKTHNDPSGLSWDRHQLAMNDKLANSTMKEMDFVLFAEFEMATRKANSKNIGVIGDRVLRTSAAAAYLAKHRGSLPETLPLSWDAFQDAVEADRGEDGAAMHDRIARLIDSGDFDEELHRTMFTALTAANMDVTKLAAIERRIQSKLNEKKESA